MAYINGKETFLAVVSSGASNEKIYVLDGTYLMDDYIGLAEYENMRWEGWFAGNGTKEPIYCGFYICNGYYDLGIQTKYVTDFSGSEVVMEFTGLYDGDYWADGYNDLTFYNAVVPEWLYRFVTENGVKQ